MADQTQYHADATIVPFGRYELGMDEICDYNLYLLNNAGTETKLTIDLHASMNFVLQFSNQPMWATTTKMFDENVHKMHILVCIVLGGNYTQKKCDRRNLH